MNINDHMLYSIYYAVTILQICIQIYMMVFTLSLFFTIIQVTLIPHDSAQDKYDYEFLYQKSVQNLEYQELQIFFSGASKWLKGFRLVYALIKKKNLALIKLKQMLGLMHESQIVDTEKYQSGRMIVYEYNN